MVVPHTGHNDIAKGLEFGILSWGSMLMSNGKDDPEVCK